MQEVCSVSSCTDVWMTMCHTTSAYRFTPIYSTFEHFGYHTGDELSTHEALCICSWRFWKTAIQLRAARCTWSRSPMAHRFCCFESLGAGATDSTGQSPTFYAF